MYTLKMADCLIQRLMGREVFDIIIIGGASSVVQPLIILFNPMLDLLWPSLRKILPTSLPQHLCPSVIFVFNSV